jgi:hypothetical protein
MSTLKNLIDLLGGKYFEAEIKKGHTPGGTFISQNSSGLITKENYSIRIYCFSNMGTRGTGVFEGSPYKLVISFPFTLKNNQTIFPKTFIQKILSKLNKNKNRSREAQYLLKKYSLKGNRVLTNCILNDSFLTKTIPNHTIYISSKNEDKNSFISLTPNESILTVEDLKALYIIMNRLAEIIVKNKFILSK